VDYSWLEVKGIMKLKHNQTTEQHAASRASAKGGGMNKFLNPDLSEFSWAVPRG
jgi:hypothetical protein